MNRVYADETYRVYDVADAGAPAEMAMPNDFATAYERLVLAEGWARRRPPASGPNRPAPG